MTPLINIHTHSSKTDELSIISFDPKDFDKNINQDYSVGLHPWYIKEYMDNKLTFLEDELKKNKIIAIGECGLDYNIDNDHAIQKRVFMAQIYLSEKYQKPVIIHCVKAYNDLNTIRNMSKDPQPWIIHGFNKKTEVLRELLKNGMYISLGKSILTKKEWLQEIVSIIPTDKLFFETDDKDISVKEIYEAYSQASGLDIESLKDQIFNNYKNVFIGE